MSFTGFLLFYRYSVYENIVGAGQGGAELRGQPDLRLSVHPLQAYQYLFNSVEKQQGAHEAAMSEDSCWHSDSHSTSEVSIPIWDTISNSSFSLTYSLV